MVDVRAVVMSVSITTLIAIMLVWALPTHDTHREVTVKDGKVTTVNVPIEAEIKITEYSTKAKVFTEKKKPPKKNKDLDWSKYKSVMGGIAAEVPPRDASGLIWQTYEPRRR